MFFSRDTVRQAVKDELDRRAFPEGYICVGPSHEGLCYEVRFNHPTLDIRGRVLFRDTEFKENMDVEAFIERAKMVAHAMRLPFRRGK